jgi:hypothetical protein
MGSELRSGYCFAQETGDENDTKKESRHRTRGFPGQNKELEQSKDNKHVIPVGIPLCVVPPGRTRTGAC